MTNIKLQPSIGYKLLKDLPDVDAGTIGYYEPEDEEYVESVVFKSKYEDEPPNYYSLDVVSDNPDWFQKQLFVMDCGILLFPGDEFYIVTDGKLDSWSEGETFVANIDTPRYENHYYFSTKEKALEYLKSLEPKFKVGDIVVYNDKLDKIIEVCPVLDLPLYNYVSTLSRTAISGDNFRKATNDEIVKYYREQGWVEGVYYKEIGQEDLRQLKEIQYDPYTEIVWIVSSTNIGNKIEECELYIPKFKVGDVVVYEEWIETENRTMFVIFEIAKIDDFIYDKDGKTAYQEGHLRLPTEEELKYFTII